jgi:hypothetical protein
VFALAQDCKNLAESMEKIRLEMMMNVSTMATTEVMEVTLEKLNVEMEKFKEVEKLCHKNK